MKFRNLSLMDENGDIPMDGGLKAKAHVQEMLAAGAAQNLQNLESIAGISRSTWTWLGPGNIGGRIRTIAIHPTTPATMFAGSVGGGIWKTTNTGGTWAPVDDFMADLAVSSIVFNPASPSVMYAGTGEGFYNGDGLRGAGIFKSTDGGTTWSQLPATNNSNFFYVNRLAISPNGSTLLAATQAGIYRSIDGGATFRERPGRDGVTDIDFNPTDFDEGHRVGATTATPVLERRRRDVDGGHRSARRLVQSGRGRIRAEQPQHRVRLGRCEQRHDLSEYERRRQLRAGIEPGRPLSGRAGLVRQRALGEPGRPELDHRRRDRSVQEHERRRDHFANQRLVQRPSSDHADHHVIVSPPGFDNVTNKTFFSGDDGGVYKAADWSTVGGGGASDCTLVSPFNCTPGWTSLNNNLGVTQFYGGARPAGTGRFCSAARRTTARWSSTATRRPGRPSSAATAATPRSIRRTPTRCTASTSTCSCTAA